jgi:hypothetical protein
MCLALDNGPLVDLTASETRHGADGIDPFYLGVGWGLIGRFDPRTCSVEELIASMIAANVEDELEELAELDEDDEPDEDQP